MNELLTLDKYFINSAPKTNSKIKASNDIEAVECFLNEYKAKITTFRSYKKEVDRFLVWCLKERNTSLLYLNREDVENYIIFLKNPTPNDLWCGPKGGRKKSNKQWYPFTGPLSDSGIKIALTILNSMMSYLVDARYVEFNPFLLIRRKNRFQDRSFSVQERILDEREWKLIIETLEEELLDKNKQERLKFLIYILYFLGLRIEEVSKARWSQIKKLNGKWWFFVHGKGDRLGKVPVNSILLAAMIRYRHFMGLSPLPDDKDDGFLISSLTKVGGLTTRQLSNIIKELSYRAAQKLEKDDKSYEKLIKFSPHWLRHLSASRQDSAGISFTNIRSNLRHQNEQTTRQYVHALDEERHKEMEKLKI